MLLIEYGKQKNNTVGMNLNIQSLRLFHFVHQMNITIFIMIKTMEIMPYFSLFGIIYLEQINPIMNLKLNNNLFK